jgi:hypothetical protein
MADQPTRYVDNLVSTQEHASLWPSFHFLQATSQHARLKNVIAGQPVEIIGVVAVFETAIQGLDHTLSGFIPQQCERESLRKLLELLEISVGRRIITDHQSKVRVILRKYALDGLLNETLMVERWHHDGDGWSAHGGRRKVASRH